MHCRIKVEKMQKTSRGFETLASVLFSPERLSQRNMPSNAQTLTIKFSLNS